MEIEIRSGLDIFGIQFNLSFIAPCFIQSATVIYFFTFVIFIVVAAVFFTSLSYGHVFYLHPSTVLQTRNDSQPLDFFYILHVLES